jgi:trimeric autotransporter adhesin
MTFKTIATFDTALRSLIRPATGRHPFVLIALTLACLALAPVAQAKPPSEDRGNGNSAAENVDALNLSTTGANNTAHGWFSLFSNTTGSFNTADGFQALFSNTVGISNTATGVQALFLNTTGSFNVANGYNALNRNTEGEFNTATGAEALFNNTTGSLNTANGYQALYSNTTGPFNTAVGNAALFNNITGDRNTAMGDGAMIANQTGSSNTAMGVSALRNNTTGTQNVAMGHNALLHNNAGANTAIGVAALRFNDFGVGNTALGYSAGFNITGSGNVCIGHDVTGLGGVNNTTWIRNVFASVATGAQVYVNADDQIGTLPSSRRFKEEIKPMEKASEVLFALKPVSFRYKKEFDAGGAPMFGLIAEDVEQVDPDLVSRNENGEVETVRYEQINAMLLNEFLKEHRKVEQQERKIREQDATITQLKQDFHSKLAQQQKQIEALTAGLQKVSVQIEASKPAPQVVNNP